MFYLDKNKSLSEGVPNEAYRYYGGDSKLQGAFLTDQLYDTPDEAKAALALSDVDWDCVNDANHVAECTVWSTIEGNMLDFEEMEPSDQQFEWNTVAPSSDYPGGGNEILVSNFDNYVQVNDQLTYNEDLESWCSDNNPYEINNEDMNTIDNLIGDEEYNIQKDDVEENIWGEDALLSADDENWQWDMVDSNNQGIDDIIGDSLWENQTEPDDDSWDDVDYDTGRDARGLEDEY